jgi:hypothetical protein
LPNTSDREPVLAGARVGGEGKVVVRDGIQRDAFLHPLAVVVFAAGTVSIDTDGRKVPIRPDAVDTPSAIGANSLETAPFAAHFRRSVAVTLDLSLRAKMVRAVTGH